MISLITVPFLAIPMYWLLGRTRFSGYVGGRREKDERLADLADGFFIGNSLRGLIPARLLDATATG